MPKFRVNVQFLSSPVYLDGAEYLHFQVHNFFCHMYSVGLCMWLLHGALLVAISIIREFPFPSCSFGFSVLEIGIQGIVPLIVVFLSPLL